MASLDARPIHLKTQLGKDVLLPRVFACSEKISEPFQYHLTALSENGDLNPDDMLGKDVTVTYNLPSGGGKRHFHGIVFEFAQLGYARRYHEYQAVVRPWFWLLTRTADCRIFQGKSVPDIFEEVVKNYGFSDYKLKLSGSYQKRDYCVQYRESDFAFLSRLLEEEGIYYFFEHSESSHLMVLADDAGAHTTVSGYDTVPYFPPDAPDAQRERDHLTAWRFTKAIQTGTYATTDYDFKNPRQSLLASDTVSRKHARASYEVFDYPAELAALTSGESSRVAKLRIQELQANYMVAQGEGNAAGLATGRRFKLKDYPRKDLNIEYIISGTDIEITTDAYDTGAGGGESEFRLMSIIAVDAKTPYRPARVTPKPAIRGAQTAMVVGPKGEEIYTDEHARVKVQFHWDRYGKSDENSSCWLRVSQAWAGKNWGSIHIPRIGQEVIVGFLEGDPDQPIITGRVYNGDNKAPYDLPANKTQSGIKSRSSKDGAAANFNEIRFEDLKGSEQLFIHAEKNQDIEVENDETHWVGHDRTRRVDHDENVLVKHDRSMIINHDKKEQVDNDKTIVVGASHTESIGSSMSISVGSTLTETVGVNYAENVGAAMELTVGAALAITVGAAMSESVGGAKVESIGAAKSENIGGSRSLQVGGDASETIGKELTVSVTKDAKTTIGGQSKVSVTKEYVLNAKKIQLVGEDEINIKVGSAELVMKSNGDITLKGNNITVKGSGKTIVKGSQIAEN